MSPEVIGVLGVVSLLVLLSLGVRIGVALGIVGFVGLSVMISPEAAIIKGGIIAFDMVSRYELGVLPLFMLMAHLCFAAGASSDFFNASAKFLGHKPGGLALAGIGACGGFGAISGSSLATVATVGLVALPEMRKYNYSPALATGAIAAGGSAGALIPPSAALIVFGILAEQSIGKLFTAAIIPGVTQVLFYMIVIVLLCAWRPSLGPPLPRATWRERFASLRNLWDIALLILLVIGGIAVGWFSPTEAASAGCIGAVGICAIRRKLTWASLAESLRETLRTTGMIYVVIIGAIVFSTFIASVGLADQVADLVASMNAGPLEVLFIMVLVILLLGMFLDGLALMTLTIPIFLPIVQTVGIDTVLFGVILVRAMEIGFVHPPVGMNVYVVHSLAKDVPLMTVFKGIVPFLIADLIHLTILVLVPGLTLFLPKLLGT